VSVAIASTSFLVIGAGGLGCPALLGLRAAGARRVLVVDPDRVEASNLHRQVLYSPGDVGAPKAEVAARSLALAGIDARAIVRRLGPADIAALVAELPSQSIVLECTDAPELKFATNDACVAAGVPLVLAAALGLVGHVIAIGRDGGCYRCVFEAPPPAELVPSCATAGVLGTAVGTAGWLQALLAVRMAEASADADVLGRLHVLDLARGTIRTTGGRSRPDCPACATRAPRSAAVAALH
jgi:molybdopterin/thiamine biosynthesis adenylyltransferase